MSNTAKLRLVVADDHVLFRQGLVRMLDDEGTLEVVSQVGTGDDALAAIAAARPDLALLDLSMPPRGGMDVLRELSRQRDPTPCVMVSMSATAEAAERCLEAGARGYCLKDQGLDEVLFAIRSVSAGGIFVSPRLARALHKPRTEGSVLTRRERQIVGLIGDGNTSRAIAEELHISVRTVDAHRRNIVRKLSLDSAAALVAYAVRQKLNTT